MCKSNCPSVRILLLQLCEMRGTPLQHFVNFYVETSNPQSLGILWILWVLRSGPAGVSFLPLSFSFFSNSSFYGWVIWIKVFVLGPRRFFDGRRVRGRSPFKGVTPKHKFGCQLSEEPCPWGPCCLASVPAASCWSSISGSKLPWAGPAAVASNAAASSWSSFLEWTFTCPWEACCLVRVPAGGFWAGPAAVASSVAARSWSGISRSKFPCP